MNNSIHRHSIGPFTFTAYWDKYLRAGAGRYYYHRSVTYWARAFGWTAVVEIATGASE